MSTKLLLSTAVSAALLLAGCATDTAPPVKVSDIVKDRRGYLAKTFAPDTLPPAIRDQFTAAAPTSLPFKELTLTFEVTQHDVNPAPNKANDVKHREVMVLTDAGNGFVESQTESSTNDIPNSLYLVLSYDNLFTLKSQSLIYNAVNAQGVNQPDSVSDISKDALHPKDNSAYSFSEHAYSKDFTFQCQSGKSYAANALLPKLGGNALDLDCNFTSDGVVSRRSKLTYLSAYGVYISRETDTSTTSFLFRLVDVAAR